MTETDRKLLTEFLGECWHKWEDRSSVTDFRPHKCIKCNFETKQFHYYRTFDTWQDLGVLKERLKTKNEKDFLLDTFNRFAHTIWEKELTLDGYFADWLYTPTRFCQLVADFLKEGVIQ